jgi:hypothetical protein
MIASFTDDGAHSLENIQRAGLLVKRAQLRLPAAAPERRGAIICPPLLLDVAAATKSSPPVSRPSFHPVDRREVTVGFFFRYCFSTAG